VGQREKKSGNEGDVSRRRAPWLVEKIWVSKGGYKIVGRLKRGPGHGTLRTGGGQNAHPHCCKRNRVNLEGNWGNWNKHWGESNILGSGETFPNIKPRKKGGLGDLLKWGPRQAQKWVSRKGPYPVGGGDLSGLRNEQMLEGRRILKSLGHRYEKRKRKVGRPVPANIGGGHFRIPKMY